ncbi:FtsX-like permease family protein [Rubneribacter badeniensis]|uniref:FtsX-like permease family protein n=1 Tax=Rubneribacter badeniensis TaxID=2070688 RepID=UPI003A915F91
MLARLAVRNVRRSVRDYAVYFVTLVFGVAAFYAFNSVQSQSVLFDLEGVASADAFDLTARFLGMFSVLIAFVLGFLVVYANRFLIRRRKREFGTYLLLGMRPAQVSAIVLMETVCVGAASLAAGLVLGAVLSQGLSFLTAGLFNIPMQQYRFVFSGEALRQTLLCFALVFAVVALFNTLSLRRCRLVDLLGAAARSERATVRRPWVGLLGFAVAVGLLAWAYVTLFESGLTEFGAEFWKATALMVAGTFLFFWSAAGFAVAALERTPGVYFRGLAMFTTRQVASKVNTAFLSLSTVCVMLFFSLAVFSTGSGLVQVFSDGVEEGTLFDATLTANAYLALEGGGEEAAADVAERAGAYDWDIARFLRESAPNWDEFVEASVQVDLYQPREVTETYGEVMERLGAGAGGGLQEQALAPQTVAVVGLSQFNAARALAGREPIELSAGTYAVNNAVALSEELSRAMAEEGVEIEVGGRALEASGLYVEQPLSTSTFVSDGAMLVVPDETVEALRADGEAPYASYLDLSYRTDRAEGDRLLEEALACALPAEGQEARGSGYETSPWPVTTVYTADEVIEQSGGMRMMITYLALYIGFVFLITTAALLAVQQLSEASDSLARYRMLAEIGCERRMMFRSIFIQVAVYFLAPLALAACHTACAVSVIARDVLDQLGVSASEAVFAAAAFTALVYGGYLLVTYLASRSLVRASLSKRLLG